MATIKGTTNNDTLKGGLGNDLIYGYAGNDRALMGGGNDTFVWKAGEGDDTVEGGSGSDTLLLHSDKAETIDISASGTRAHVYRSIDSATVDLNDVERIDVRAHGGADDITVRSLAGTDVKLVAIDLAGMTPGVADGVADIVSCYGTKGNDAITVALVNNRVSMTGLAAQVTVANPDANDVLRIQGADGNDVVDASTLSAGIMHVSLHGGEGNDRITGSKGNDLLDGDDGNDTIVGGRGNDNVSLGAGNDLYLWQAGDGVDGIQCGTGFDTVRLTGSNADEQLEVGGSGTGFYFYRNNVYQGDAGAAERIQIRALGGADTIQIDDFTGSAVRQVTVDLAATAGGTSADTKTDTVWARGSTNNDVMDVRWINGQLRVTGLTAEVSVVHTGTNDTIIVNGLAGNDVLNASTMPAGKVRLQLRGDDGNDVIFGGAGNDVVIGGDDYDVAFMGGGNDRFVWDTGDDADKVDGQAGTDTVVFNSTGESFEVGAASDRVNVFTSSGVVDLDQVEIIRIVQASNGGDSVGVGNLAGTDVKQVAIDLGLADGYMDGVYARGGDGNNQMTVSMSSTGVVSVGGLGAQLTVSHAGAGDTLTVLGMDGNDIINAAAMPSGDPLQLVLNGGDGNDSVSGGAADDRIYGGDGNDTVRGGAGDDNLFGDKNNDYLDGGAGSDSLSGGYGDDVILGGLGNDLVMAAAGNDTITGGAGNDRFGYTSVLDGHDVILDFDGDATGGQDELNLDALFDALGVIDGLRASRVALVDNGGTVDVQVNADGTGGFELQVATLHTADTITLGQDIILAA